MSAGYFSGYSLLYRSGWWSTLGDEFSCNESLPPQTQVSVLETESTVTNHEEAVARWFQRDSVGTEIGAFETPIPSLNPIYVDRFAEYAGKPCLADYWGDACRLPFKSNSLNYVATSHVLEHVANPVSALLEWHRVLVSGGLMYMVVPDRRKTFDHPRELTDPEHMWKDYLNGTNQSDPTHINEFVTGVDWSMYRPEIAEDRIESEQAAEQDQYHHAIRNRVEINIHFHVFEPGNLVKLVQLVAERKRLHWEILTCRDGFPNTCPNGVLLVVKVSKRGCSKWASWFHRWQAKRNRLAVLSRSARPIAEDAELRKYF